MSNEILVRFYDSAGKFMASEKGLNIEIEDRTSKEAAQLIEEQRFEEMRKRNKSQMRRHRADTGDALFDASGIEAVSVKDFILDVIGLGYQIVDVFAEKKPRMVEGKPHGTRVVTTIAFSDDKNEQPYDKGEDKDKTLKEFLKVLDGFVAKHTHVWRNDYNDTVNFLSKLDEPAKQVLRLTKGKETPYASYPASE